MCNTTDQKSFECSIPYEAKRIRAAAVYCSDGRVGEHFDDFLTHGLRLPRYDRIALPGGPVVLAGREETHLANHGVIDNLRFLIEAHELERVILIAHEGCAFYAQRLGIEKDRLEAIQRRDLAKSAAYVTEQIGLTSVETYFARIVEGGMRFEVVDVSGRGIG